MSAAIDRLLLLVDTSDTVPLVVIIVLLLLVLLLDWLGDWLELHQLAKFRRAAEAKAARAPRRSHQP